MSLLNRIRNWKPFGGTQSPHAAQQKGWVNTNDGWLNSNWDAGWWQQDRQPLTLSGINGTVEACVSALAQTAAMCPVHLYDEDEYGTRHRRRASNPERVLRRPNDYETSALFINNLVRSTYFTGNGIAVAMHDDRGAITSLHLMNAKNTRAVMDQKTGEVYYYATAKQNQPFIFDLDTDRIFPARKVLHLRLYTDLDPLRGVTPLQAATNSVQANSAIMGHQSQFFSRMSRPSGVLSTEQLLQPDQMKQLRQAFREQSAEIDSGGIPVLGGGLKFQPMSLSNEDAQLAEAFGMTVTDISRVFRVPPPVINHMDGATFNNADTLMRFFLSSGLGFLLQSIELELGRLFAVPFASDFSFETEALLRSDWKTRMEALGEGTLKGVYSPNEARAKEGLPPVKGGELPRVQQQVVPLDAWQMAPPTPEPAPTDEEVEAQLRDEFRREKTLD